MHNKCSMARCLLGVAMIMVVSACAMHVPIKQVSDNKFGYLDENFSPAVLPSGVSQPIVSARGNAPRFNKIEFTVEAIYRRSDGKEEPPKTIKETYLNAGNGFVKRLAEYSSNDIPYGLNFQLSYRMIYALRAQSAYLNRATTNAMFEMKQITKFPQGIAEPAEGAEYVIEYTSGPTVQIANFPTFRTVCRAGKFYPAQKFNEKMSGQAVELACEIYRDNVLAEKIEHVYFPFYGIAIKTKASNSTVSDTFRVISMEIS